MSWVQGITPREELPASFVAWADTKAAEPLQYITWFGVNPAEVILDYGEAGSVKVSLKGKAA